MTLSGGSSRDAGTGAARRGAARRRRRIFAVAALLAFVVTLVAGFAVLHRESLAFWQKSGTSSAAAPAAPALPVSATPAEHPSPANSRRKPASPGGGSTTGRTPSTPATEPGSTQETTAGPAAPATRTAPKPATAKPRKDAPRITLLTPLAGPPGSTVTLGGVHLAGTRSVTFGGGATASFVQISPTQVRTTVPSGAESGQIAIVTATGSTHTDLHFDVTDNPPPSIATMNPTSGAPGTTVVLGGFYFGGTTRVAFNGTPARFVLLSATKLQVTVPVGATTGPVSVTASGGTAETALTFEVR